MSYEISPLRWYLKKAARGVTTRACSNLAQLRRNSCRGPRIRVLTYHRFTNQKFDPVAVKPRDFERHLQWLLGNVELLDEITFQKACSGGLKLNRDAVLLTVDDGHRSFFEHAYPLLKTYDVPAIVFVCPGLIDAESPTRKFMTWDELREISRGRITVASHGYSHNSLGRLDAEAAEQEVLSARALLQQHLNVDNPFFAFPFGTRKDFSAPLADMLLHHGYRYCFTSMHGSCEPMMKPNLFPRLKIESGESLSVFAAIVRGHLDAWRLVDQAAWRLQQNGLY